MGTEAKRILAVDDDPIVLRMVELGLRGRGYEIHTATNGEIGLAKAKALRPHLIILTNGTTTYCGWNIDELELLAFNTLPPVSYDPPLAAAPLREGNDLVLAWQPTTPSPYYRVEWRPSSAPGVDWQVLALCTGTELRIDRGYALLGHSGLFRVVSTDRTNGLVPVLSVPAETLISR